MAHRPSADLKVAAGRRRAALHHAIVLVIHEMAVEWNISRKGCGKKQLQS
jgi:hypothetical protein